MNGNRQWKMKINRIGWMDGRMTLALAFVVRGKNGLVGKEIEFAGSNHANSSFAEIHE